MNKSLPGREAEGGEQLVLRNGRWCTGSSEFIFIIKTRNFPTIDVSVIQRITG